MRCSPHVPSLRRPIPSNRPESSWAKSKSSGLKEHCPSTTPHKANRPWEPSVKSLAALSEPSQMIRSIKIDWTQKLAMHFLAQQKDVLADCAVAAQHGVAQGSLKDLHYQKRSSTETENNHNGHQDQPTNPSRIVPRHQQPDGLVDG